VAIRELAKACEAARILFFQIGTDYVAEGYPTTSPSRNPPRPPNSIYSLTRFGGDCMTLTHAPPSAMSCAPAACLASPAVSSRAASILSTR